MRLSGVPRRLDDQAADGDEDGGNEHPRSRHQPQDRDPGTLPDPDLPRLRALAGSGDKNSTVSTMKSTTFIPTKMAPHRLRTVPASASMADDRERSPALATGRDNANWPVR